MNIGLALGSGSSRGWAHIGVIKALAKQGIVPNIICGTSIGALVGASYAFNNLEHLEQWVRSLTKLDTARFFEINTALTGFVNTEKLHKFLKRYVARAEDTIEMAPIKYAAVSTQLESGRETWLIDGSVLNAVFSSIALPGLFPAILHNDKWLVDGGLVNPVPVSVCRAMGADIVIAVNLNDDIVNKNYHRQAKNIKRGEGIVARITNRVADYTTSLIHDKKSHNQPPNLFEAIAGSINIAQDRITRSRMAGDPPDILLNPKLSHIGLLEFHRANEAIVEGEQCVRRMLPEIHHVFDFYK